MKIQKTIKCGIVEPTKIKQQLLTEEYENLQQFLRGNNNVRLYSANKQQAKRYYKIIKPDKEYPLSIRKDLIKIEKRDTKIAKYWARIPIGIKTGGIWVAIKPHQSIPDDVNIGESKLFRKDGNWFLYLTIEKEVNVKEVKDKNFKGYKFEAENKRSVMISIDIGDKNPITSVELWDNDKSTNDDNVNEQEQEQKQKNVQFLGKEIREIRTKYYWIRKTIGKKKVKHGIKVIKEIGNKEQKKVNDFLHKITTKIIYRAIELKQQGYNPIIVFGDVKNIQPKNGEKRSKSKKLNRILNSIPTYKIKQMLIYKALWNGINIFAVNEAWTSKTCHKCGSINTIIKGRHFKCNGCELEYNRDLNGAVNIGNKLFGYMLKSRGSSEPPITLPENITITQRGEKLHLLR